MAIGTYSELKTAVANYLHRVDLTDRIPEFIAAAEQRINNELVLRGGIPDQEQIAYASTVASQESLELPTRFGMLRWIKIDDSSDSPVDPLEVVPYDTLLETYGVTTGVPQKVAVVDESFYFRPIPDAVYTVRVCYIKRYAALSGSTDTNFLLTGGGNLLLYAALLESAGFIDDDRRIATWGQGYKEAMENLRIMARRARRHRAPELRVDSDLMAIGAARSGWTIYDG